MAGKKQLSNGLITVDEFYFRHMLSLLAANWGGLDMTPDISGEMAENIAESTEMALRQGRAMLDSRRASYEDKLDDKRDIKYEDFL